MYYEKYLVPGRQGYSMIIGRVDILLQEIEEGMMVHEFKEETLVREMIVPKLTPEQAATLRVLGDAECGDVSQCFWLSIKHEPTFLSGLKGYTPKVPEMEGMKAAVTFYAAHEVPAGAVDMVESSLMPGRMLVGGGHA